MANPKLSCFYGSVYGVCKKCKDFFFTQVKPISPETTKQPKPRATTLLRLRCCEAAGMCKDKVGSGRTLFNSEGIDVSTFGNRCAACVLLELNKGKGPNVPLDFPSGPFVVLPAALAAPAAVVMPSAVCVGGAAAGAAPVVPANAAQAMVPAMFVQDNQSAEDNTAGYTGQCSQLQAAPNVVDCFMASLGFVEDFGLSFYSPSPAGDGGWISAGSELPFDEEDDLPPLPSSLSATTSFASCT